MKSIKNKQILSYLNLVDLETYPFKLDDTEHKYFSKKNSKILLNKNASDALLNAQNMLPPKFKFVINWGYRGYNVQYQVNEFMKEKLKKKYPDDWSEQLDIFTGGDGYLEYIKNTPIEELSPMSHASGKAVDIVGIVDNKSKLLNFGDQHNDKRDCIDYYESGIVSDNRKLLKKILTENKFENYKHEWWHWGYLN
jgi:D-alanyl-D-alanine dipeptidase